MACFIGSGLQIPRARARGLIEASCEHARRGDPGQFRVGPHLRLRIPAGKEIPSSFLGVATPVLAGYAELGITGLMPSGGLCRVLPVSGSGAARESLVCSA